MNIFSELTADTILLDLHSETKAEIIAEMLDALIAAGRVASDKRADVLAALMAREAKMSTGMEHGIAIPHAKTEAVEELVACVAVTREPIDIESVDGHPARIFIMTLSPKEASGPHVRFLSEIGKLLRHRANRQAVLDARTRAELLQALLR